VRRPEPDRDKVAAMLKLVLDQGCDDLYVQCLYWAARGNRAPLKDAVKGQRQFIEFMDGPYDAGLK
jgi:hypothetical protein